MGRHPQTQRHDARLYYVYVDVRMQHNTLTRFADSLCRTLATHNTDQGNATNTGTNRGDGRKHHNSQWTTHTAQTTDVQTKSCSY